MLNTRTEPISPCHRKGCRARHRHAVAALIAGTLCGGPAVAGLTHEDVLAPGGFVSAYAGLAGAGTPAAGGDYEPHYAPGELVLDEATFNGMTSATASASYAKSPYVNSSAGTVTLGALL